jgi:hypothetical protein
VYSILGEILYSLKTSNFNRQYRIYSQACISVIVNTILLLLSTLICEKA